jgi:hypothetical protein
MGKFVKEQKFNDEVKKAYDDFCDHYNYEAKLYSYEERMIKEALDHFINGDKNVKDIQKDNAK